MWYIWCLFSQCSQGLRLRPSSPPLAGFWKVSLSRPPSAGSESSDWTHLSLRCFLSAKKTLDQKYRGVDEHATYTQHFEKDTVVFFRDFGKNTIIYIHQKFSMVGAPFFYREFLYFWKKHVVRFNFHGLHVWPFSAWMSRWKLGSMVRINGLFHLLINGIYWGYFTPIDPNHWS